MEAGGDGWGGRTRMNIWCGMGYNSALYYYRDLAGEGWWAALEGGLRF